MTYIVIFKKLSSYFVINFYFRNLFIVTTLIVEDAEKRYKKAVDTLNVITDLNRI